MTGLISPELTARWQTAHTELKHALHNQQHPRFDDYLFEITQRVAAAHRELADIYQEMATLVSLPTPLTAAAATAQQHHAAAAQKVPSHAE